nr:hypothetical protein [Kibdelosporangium sp. MJ126-NF4]CTQ96187.1 hypothetical protein [Kibdelosporangium sp. MJ126-NF4]
MTIPFLPTHFMSTEHSWPVTPTQTIWLTALLGILLIFKLRFPP